MRKFTQFVPEEMDMVYEDLSVETNDLYRLLEEAVMNLPEKCAKIFRMHHEEDLTYKEIADREGIAEKTVEAHLYTALKRLRKYIVKKIILL